MPRKPNTEGTLSRCMGNKAQAKLCKTCARFPRNVEEEEDEHWIDYRARQSNPDHPCKAYREISAGYFASLRKNKEGGLSAQRKET